MVRVRFAPSPTGHLHIGGARTAIFNWLFARHNKGKFILRIEDTDRTRSTEEFMEEILDSMKWLGLDWDEGPYRQTDRFDIYMGEAKRLIESGRAYYCWCTPEELEEIKEEMRKKCGIPKYDGRCRNRKEPREGVNPVIRFKVNNEGYTVFNDLIRGEIAYPNEQLDDFIIVRSDGTPTYNFVVVVDDAFMNITHVIRGEDHINNTPKQIQLYEALGYPVPYFAHVPMILGPDRKKLSKRHGAVSVRAYREEGILPEALFNFLVRLGWSYGDREIFSKEELIEIFRLEDVGKSPAVYNYEKLLWLNQHYIRTYDIDKLVDIYVEFLIKEGIVSSENIPPRDYLREVVLAFRDRSRTIKEMVQFSSFLYRDDIDYDPEGVKKFFTEEKIPYLESLIEEVENRETLTPQVVEEIFNTVITKHNIKLKDIAQTVRVAITGKTVSPGLVEVIVLTGKEKLIRRIKKAIDCIKTSREV